MSLAKRLAPDLDSNDVIKNTTSQKTESKNLPKSIIFSDDDVKAFEKTINSCMVCPSHCKGKKIAKYLLKFGLDEFKNQKANNSLPDEIKCAIHSMRIAHNISYDNHAVIYGKLL